MSERKKVLWFHLVGNFEFAHLINSIGWCLIPLELHTSIPRSLLSLPATLRRHDANTFLFAIADDSSRLPPLVVRCVRDVENVAVLERQSARGQAVVAVRVIVEQGAHVQRTLLWCAEQRSGAADGLRGRRLLLQLVDPRLEAVVVLGTILSDQRDGAAGILQCLRRLLVRRALQVHAVDAHQLIATLQLAAGIRRPTSENERHVNPLKLTMKQEHRDARWTRLKSITSWGNTQGGESGEEESCKH